MSKPLPSLTGTVVGHWTVGKQTSQARFSCLCSKCGKPSSLPKGKLRRGEVLPCRRCEMFANPEAKPFRSKIPLPEPGTMFGSRVVLGSRVVRKENGECRRFLIVRCKCGLESLLQASQLRKREGGACQSCTRKDHPRKPPKPRRPKEPKPVKTPRPMKLAAVKPTKPKAAVKVPMVDVPLPTEWNAKTILDLIVRREALRQEWVTAD